MLKLKRLRAALLWHLVDVWDWCREWGWVVALVAGASAVIGYGYLDPDAAACRT